MHAAVSFRSERLRRLRELLHLTPPLVFAILAVTFVADVKGFAYLHSFGAEQPVRIALNLAICVAGIFVSNRRVQIGLLLASFIYHVFTIV
ncbi:MAG TPA: hypothetical protein VH477_03655, partial [Bryobacteraceae bacterium]